MKTWLITLLKDLDKDTLYEFSNLPYNKIFLLYLGEKKDVNFKFNSKTELIFCENLNILNSEINRIHEENSSIKLFPFFRWDAFSKYAIKIYNKTFDTKIDWKIFKEKDFMMNFLWDIAQKKFVRLKYEELISKKYSEIKKNIWKNFIIKPTNAASSVSTFKISDEKTFEKIKDKINKSYEYLVEEYIWWELYSLDFFIDWEKIFLLNYTREIPMIELSDKNKFSEKFLNKYWEEISKHFNFNLPIRYWLDFSKILKEEYSFFQTLRKKLQTISYRWFIHLEYKFDKKNNKIWFIEWWARLWWNRSTYIKKLYHNNVLNTNKNLLANKDFWNFEEACEWIYKLKDKEFNLNLVWIKTNFLKTTNYIEILKKTWNITHESFAYFIKKYLRKEFSIEIQNISFEIKHSKDFNFYPFYKNDKTRFDYILELDDENFKILKKKKFQIIEKIIFHNYD